MTMNYLAACVGGVVDGGTVDKGVQWQKEGQECERSDSMLLP